MQKVNINKKWFFFICLYLIIDLCRPQFFLPISALRPGMLVTLMLIWSLWSSGKVKDVIGYRQMKHVSLFVLLLTVYVPFAANGFRAYQAARTMLLILPLLFSILIVINTRNRIISLLKMYTAILLFLSVFSLTHAGRGPGGSIADENDLCLFIVTFLPFVFFLLGREESIKGKLVFIATISISLLSIISTFSRGGFVGLIAMTGVYWWFSKRKLSLAIGVILLGVIFFISGGGDYRQEMLSVADTKENTAKERLLTWQAGWNMFLDNPQGVGGNNFPVHFSNYQVEGHYRDMWGRAAHSLWFTLIPETGVMGIYLFIFIIIVNLRDLFYLRKIDIRPEMEKMFFEKISVAFLASFAGFFTSATFISVLYYPTFWQLTALVVATRTVAFTHLSAAKKEVMNG